jgi:hypothetical protein
MGVDVMRTVFNLEHKYRVTMMNREEWTRGPGTHPIVKGLIWFTNGSRMAEGTGAGFFLAIFRNKAQYLSRKTCYSLSG